MVVRRVPDLKQAAAPLSSVCPFYIKPTSGANAEKWMMVGKVEEVSGFSKAVFTGAVTGNRRYAYIAFYRGTEEFDALNLG